MNWLLLKLLALVPEGQYIKRVGRSFVGDTPVTPSGAQTLTDKTLTSPRVGGAILDTNGNEVIKTPATASAVNEVTITNAPTSGAPSLAATGDDVNIGLVVKTKGTGEGDLRTGANSLDAVRWSESIGVVQVGFFGASPVPQPSTQAAVGAQDVGAAPDQTSINAAINAVQASHDALLAKLKALGIIAT